MIDTLRERQLRREQLQVDEGVFRYRKDLATKDPTDMVPGRVLVRRAVEPVAHAIEALVEEVEAGRAGRGRPALAVRYLQELQPVPVAFITARVVISAAVAGDRLPKTAMALSTLLSEHYQFDQLREAEPALENAMRRKAAKYSTPFHRRAIMRLASKVADVTGLEWGQGDRLHLGMKLIDLFIETTGLVEQVLVSEGRNRTQYVLRPTAQTSEWLARMHERCEVLEPRFTPMVCPPEPWTSPISGGYLTRENRVDFIGGVSAEMRDDVFSVEMDEVYRAVSAVQATPWQINRAVFDVLSAVWAAGDTLGGLPSQDWEPIPERPADIPGDIPREDMPEEMRRRFDGWRRAAAATHDRNASLISKRIAVASKLSMAADVKDEEAIYFPHNCDFRGRIYSVVPGLCPQGDDVGKALLQFADGRPLGENGAYWLHVHIANLFGVDKVSFDDRVEWTRTHTTQLLDSALRPLDGDRFWTQADDPWCALAACFEYAGWCMRGNDYVSHLPIAMDGSCSGLQHFSAMLKDAQGAVAVNLVPQASPADIYTQVAERVEAILLEESDQLAMSWRGKVLRKIVKRPCMTFAYSVTSRGMRDQVLDEMRKQADGGQYLPGWENYEAASYLAPIVDRAIRETVDRAAEAMDWLKEAVRQTLEADEPVVWFTPDGFPVQHRYVRTNGKRFDVWFQGQRLQVQLRVDTKRQDLRKHQSAIAPNYVHSMDATHLRMVVRRLVDEGITDSFAVVHDSFGVHACDVDELHFALREEFIRLYEADRLGEFRDQVVSRLPAEQAAEVPPCPEPGSLELAAVRSADFFFA